MRCGKSESFKTLNPSNTEFNPICYLLALLEPHLILHVSRIGVNDCGTVVTEREL